MRTWKGLITGVAIASMALLSYPGVSFGQDCSYGGVFSPPLPSQSGFCVGSGSPKTLGSVIVTASNWLFITQGFKLNINEEPLQGFPFAVIPGSLAIQPGGTIGTIFPVLNPIQINAAGAIINFQGALNLWAPTDPIVLKAGKGISLQGDPAIFDPSSLFIGDTIKLETTKGDITTDNNTVLLSMGDQANVRLIAPRGRITLENTTIFVLKGGGSELGICNFQAKTPADVIFGPGTALGCIPKIKD